MRRLTTREQVLLGLVTVGGAGYLWYASQRAVISTTGPFEFASDGRRLADGAPRVPMALLAVSGEKYDRNGRDLFAWPFASRVIVHEAQPVETGDAPSVAVEAPESGSESADPGARPVVDSVPRIPYEYVGYLGPKDDRIAVFQDGEVVHLARTGELLQGAFRVVEIRYESVVVGYTDREFEARTRELPMIGGHKS